jgi:hypothetical protein
VGDALSPAARKRRRKRQDGACGGILAGLGPERNQRGNARPGPDSPPSVTWGTSCAKESGPGGPGAARLRRTDYWVGRAIQSTVVPTGAFVAEPLDVLRRNVKPLAVFDVTMRYWSRCGPNETVLVNIEVTL